MAPNPPKVVVVAEQTGIAGETTATRRAPSRRTPSRRLIIALSAVALLAFGYLAMNAFSDSVVYYRTPTEAASMPGAHVRLSGSVVPGSITALASEGISFGVTDGSTTMTVSYAGARPTSLRDGGDVVAEGDVGPEGTFHATTLVTKCPSKFEGKTGVSNG